MSQLSDTATSVLTLLNNINELIVKSSDRKNAEMVMRALRAYAKGKGFEINENLINNFFAVINDARPYTLTIILKDIAEDVLIAESKDKNKSKKNK